MKRQVTKSKTGDPHFIDDDYNLENLETGSEYKIFILSTTPRTTKYIYVIQKQRRDHREFVTRQDPNWALKKEERAKNVPKYDM